MDEKSVTFKVSEPDHHKLGKLALDQRSSRSALAKRATLALLAKPHRKTKP